MKTNLLLSLCALLGCGYVPREAEVPLTFTVAEPVPTRPTDVQRPLDAVMWMLNYDVGQFDTVWSWLQKLPPSSERSRALAAATLVAVAELDRTDLTEQGLVAFDDAIAAFPDDARLPLWRAYILFLAARDSADATRITSALESVRGATKAYPAFTLFGLTLAVGGWEGASPQLLDEALAAFDTVVSDTGRMQQPTLGSDLERSRRIWDSPIAPYNIPAMQAMIGDLALRAGNKEKAQRAYFTALRTNAAARWPYRAEVQRRLEHLDEAQTALNARPATLYTFGSQGKHAMGMANTSADRRFGTRVGNGSCTVCHTHVSVFDANEAADTVGWVKIKVNRPQEVPNLQGVALLLPGGPDPIPGGFGIGPYVHVDAPRTYVSDDSLFDGTHIIPAPAGRYFVAVQTDVEGTTWQGYLPRELGLQWFLDVKPGVLLDVTEVPIQMKPLAKK